MEPYTNSNMTPHTFKMGNVPLPFVNIFLILQVVTAYHFDYQDGSQFQSLFDAENEKQDAANKVFNLMKLMQERKPLSGEGLAAIQSFFSSDTPIESTFTSPPTRKHSTAAFGDNDENIPWSPTLGEKMPESNKVKTNLPSDTLGSSSKIPHSTSSSSTLGVKNSVSNEIKPNAPSKTLSDNNIALQGTSQPSNLGAGNLETNEIVKNPKSVVKKDTPSLENDSYVTKKEANSAQPPVANNKSNTDPEKQVELALKNISTIVPLIKKFSEKVSEHQDKERTLQKQIVLKLAKKLEQQKEKIGAQSNNEERIHQGNAVTHQVSPANKITPQENKDTRQGKPVLNKDYKNVLTDNKDNIEKQKANKEVRLENSEAKTTESKRDVFQGETMLGKNLKSESTTKFQHEKEKITKDRSELKDGDFQSNDKKQNVLAHVVLRLTLPETKHTVTKQNQLLIPTGPLVKDQPFQSLQSSQLGNMFLRLLAGSARMNVGSQSLFDKNKDYLRQSPIFNFMATGGLRDSENESDLQEDDRSTFTRVLVSRDDDDENSEFMVPSSFTTLDSDDQTTVFPNINMDQIKKMLPKKSIFPKNIIKKLKQKAIANALQEATLPSSDEFSETSPRPVTRMITRSSNNLFPLYFPKEGSGYKIKNMEDFLRIPDFRQSYPENESTSKLRVKFSNYVQDDDDDDSSDESVPGKSISQEMPWFMKNMLSNFNKMGSSGLQPFMIPMGHSNKTSNDLPLLLQALLSRHMQFE